MKVATCSFWPCNISASSSSNDLFPPFLAKASAHLLFLPPTSDPHACFVTNNRGIIGAVWDIYVLIILTACRDEICYATALEEGSILDRREE